LKKSTYFIGRWQLLAESPLTIADSGHNVDGIRQAMQQIQNYTYDKLHLVIGFSTGKDHSQILKLFPQDAQYYWTQPSVQRALPVADLVALSEKEGLLGATFPDIATAIQAAQANASPADLIFIGGSSFVVADVLATKTLFDK
jgi:dihydrofolate synthase/folylpolyglutamate synthase